MTGRKKKARPASVIIFRTMTTYNSLPSAAHLPLTNSHGRGRSHWKEMMKDEKIAQNTMAAAKPITGLRFKASPSIRLTSSKTDILARN